MSGLNFHVSPNGKLLRVTTDSSANDSESAKAIPGGSERYAVNWLQFDQLMGRILTIVDASFAEPEQRSAVKGLVRGSIKGWVQDIAESALADEASAKGASSEGTTRGKLTYALPQSA